MRVKFSFISVLLALVFLLLFSRELWLRYNPAPLSLNIPASEIAGATSSGLMPVKIYLPDVNISLPVRPVTVKNNNWPAFADSVSFVNNSAVPGEFGNSVFYGHDYRNILGNLGNSRPGQLIYIDLSDGSRLDFIIDSIHTVNSGDVSILLADGRRQLTVYTCTGFLDSRRLVVKAYLNDGNKGHS